VLSPEFVKRKKVKGKMKEGDEEMGVCMPM
jgi:hypothetical protein